MLIPSVVDWLNIASKHKQERGQRAKVINSCLLLPLHPALDRGSVVLLPPFHQIHHHHTCVEVARLVPAVVEDLGESFVAPERVSEVFGEIGMAILWSTNGSRPQSGAPELDDVVHDNEIGIQVDYSLHTGLQNVGQVAPRVVQRMLQRKSHRCGDPKLHQRFIEVVDLESEEREGGEDERAEPCVSVPYKEMEDHILRA